MSVLFPGPEHGRLSQTEMVCGRFTGRIAMAAAAWSSRQQDSDRPAARKDDASRSDNGESYSRSLPPIPKLSPSPYLNTRLAATYVNSEACRRMPRGEVQVVCHHRPLPGVESGRCEIGTTGREFSAREKRAALPGDSKRGKALSQRDICRFPREGCRSERRSGGIGYRFRTSLAKLLDEL